MAKKYRVVHERKSLFEALIKHGGMRDCYVAQAQAWWWWRTIGTFGSEAEAEAACRDHAGGMLLPGGGRIVAEFERPEP